MTGFAINVSFREGSVLSALSKLFIAPSEKAMLLDELGINLVENTRLRFTDQRGPDGEAWVPSIRAKMQGGETLRDKGLLMNSITHLVHPDEVEVGTNVPYATPLHFGAVIRPVNGPFLRFKMPGGGWVTMKEVTLPARPFLGIDEEDKTMLVEVIDAFLKGRQQ